jgi:dihydrofolate reductase
MKIMMIVAMDEQGIIGKDETLPWKLSNDLQRFKKLTVSDGFNAVVMGRKTWESLPDGFRPLPERLNIVMSRDTKWSDDGAEIALYPGRAIEIAYANGCDELWIIGGSQIYELYLTHVEEIHVTRVHTRNSGNISFPDLDWLNWTEEIIEKIPRDGKNEYDTTYSIWRKSVK